MQDFAQRMEEHARALRAASQKPMALPGAQTPLQTLVQQEVARQLAELPQMAPAPAKQGHIEEALMVLLQQSLKPEEMAWITGEHIPAGAPGFVEFLQSDTIKLLVQMGFDAYKEFLAGQRK